MRVMLKQYDTAWELVTDLNKPEYAVYRVVSLKITNGKFFVLLERLKEGKKHGKRSSET